MNEKNYKIGDIITLKKVHPCGEYNWKVIRVGADIKIQCLGCNRTVMIPRIDLNKKIKKVREG